MKLTRARIALILIALWIIGLALALTTGAGWWIVVSCLVATVAVVTVGVVQDW